MPMPLAPMPVSPLPCPPQMSRISMHNLLKVRDEALQLLALCKRNKAAVLLLSMLGKRWSAEELFYGSWDEVPKEVQEQLQSYQTKIQAREGLRGSSKHACMCCAIAWPLLACGHGRPGKSWLACTQRLLLACHTVLYAFFSILHRHTCSRARVSPSWQLLA